MTTITNATQPRDIFNSSRFDDYSSSSPSSSPERSISSNLSPAGTNINNSVEGTARDIMELCKFIRDNAKKEEKEQNDMYRNRNAIRIADKVLKDLNDGCIDATMIESAKSEMSEIKTLRMTARRMKELPAYISYLTGLTELNVSANVLRTLPESMLQLRKLKVLMLNGNKFRELPLFLNDMIALHKRRDFDYTNVAKHSLSENSLESGPSLMTIEVGNMVKLRASKELYNVIVPNTGVDWY